MMPQEGYQSSRVLGLSLAVTFAGACTFVLRRPARIPHVYKVVTNLGRYPGLPMKKVMSRLETGQLFPLHLEGNLGAAGSQAALHLQGTRYILPPNLVEVKRHSILERQGLIHLEAGQGRHIFKGTATHIIDKTVEGDFTYTVEGRGIDGEEIWRKILNIAVAEVMWPALIKYKVKPGMDDLYNNLHNRD